MDTQTSQEISPPIAPLPQGAETPQTSGWRDSQTSQPSLTWREKLAAYRMFIIIAAVLFAGTGGIFLMMQSRNAPPAGVKQEDALSQSPAGTGGSIKLSIANDPDVLEAELGDLTGALDELDREVAELE